MDTTSLDNRTEWLGSPAESWTSKKVNASEAERWASLVTGGALALYGLSRRSWVGLCLALTGGSLVYVGATGYCPVYKILGIDHAEGRRGKVINVPAGQRSLTSERLHVEPAGCFTEAEFDDAVLEASQESFPASDPPSWTTGR